MNMVALGFIVVAALMDVASNLCVAKSKGFSRPFWVVATLVLVWGAFLALGHAVQQIDVSIGYAMWGAIGVLGTALVGRLFLHQKINRQGVLGIAMVIGAIVLLNQ